MFFEVIIESALTLSPFLLGFLIMWLIDLSRGER